MLKKKDFVEIEFTAKTKEGEIFDSNIQEDLNKANLKMEAKPFSFCIGEGMFIKGIDEFLIGKEIGKYKIELEPENAFGKRNSNLVQTIPIKIFLKHRSNPVPGSVFNFDGRIGKILTNSGGRVMVDFNNPLAGKIVIYDIKVLKKIENLHDKVKSLNEFLFRKNFEFEIKEKNLVMHVEEPLVKFVVLFKDKFKEILDLELEVKPAKAPEIKK